MINIQDVKLARKRLRNKKRFIFNDDGAAVFYYNRDYGYPVTADAWLGYAFGQHRGKGNHVVANPTMSDLTTIVFNTDYSGYVLRNSKIPSVHVGFALPTNRNLPTTQYGDATQSLIDTTGRDALQIAGDFFEDKDMEFFYSVRVNDRHDAVLTKAELVPIKQQLWDSGGLLSNGVNNALDFSNQDARKLMTDTILEVVNDDKYKITGVCIDFNRHLGLFKNVVSGKDNAIATTQEQIDIVTNWLYEINDALNAKSVERMQSGKAPLLMMVKVPDDAEFAKLCALDINKWMRDGVIDILVPINYHQFSLLQDMVAWGKSYGVAVCPSLQDTRLGNVNGRGLQDAFTGRFCQILGASPDGVEFFNYNYAYDLSYRSPSGEFWRNLDYDKIITTSERAYYPVWTHQDGKVIGTASYLPARNYYSANYPLVSPDMPYSKSSGTFLIELYEDIDKVSSMDIKLYMPVAATPPSILFNGLSLPIVTHVGDGYQAGINKSSLKKGINKIELSGLTATLTDIKIQVRS